MASLIPDHVLDQIRHGSDVVEVIGSYFPLKRTGGGFKALCPFHKEKTPSFNVNAQKQIWHCFGCGAGGDVIGFVMKYESLDFMSAVRRLAERAGVRLEVEETAVGESHDQKELLFKLHEEATGFFHGQLLKEPAAEMARQYLKKRQIGPDTVRKWRLGYSPDAWDALIQWAGKKRVKASFLETAGLALRRESGDGFYDRFRGRLMFPICDDQGRVVGFSGRMLTDAKDQPKYVNSPETPIFQKSRLLFALDKAKRAIANEKFVLICEGQIDTISCHEAGIENAVAPQGTALTEQHARILKRHADEAVLIFDADAAGQNAMVRSAEPLWENGMTLRVAVLPDGHDPDSFVKSYGRAALQELVAKAPSFFVFLLEKLSRENDPKSERGKLLISRQMVEWLAKIPSPVLQSSFLQQTAARLEVPSEAIIAELRHFRRHQRLGEKHEESLGPAATLNRGSPAEHTLLQLMLADERVVDLVLERIDRKWLSVGLTGRLVKRILEMHENKRWDGAGGLLRETQEEDASQLVTSLMMIPPPGQEHSRATQDCLAALERNSLEEEWRELRKELAQTGLPTATLAGLQQRVLDLRRRLDNIATPPKRRG